MWGLSVAFYLFLGGLSAGSFVSAATVQLAYGARFKFVISAATLFSLAFLGVGCVLLLSDVSLPLRALDITHSFTNIGGSWMARGVWIISGCGAVYATYFIVAAAPFKRFSLLRRRRQSVLNIIGILGIISSLMLAGYTGLLLSDSNGIQAWASPILPLMFTVSALDTGAAFVLLIAYLAEKRRIGGQFDFDIADKAMLVLLVAEVALLLAYGAHVSSRWAASGLLQPPLAEGGIASAELLFAQTLALLAASLGANGLRLLAPNHRRTLSGISALLAIVAGLSLRIAVLSLGLHTPLLL